MKKKQSFSTFFISILLTLSLQSYSQIVTYSSSQTITTRDFPDGFEITNGATVTFTGTFRFGAGTGATVDRKCNIILDNATFSRLNTDIRWFGIEMEGYTTRTCIYIPSENSSAVLKNSRVIGAYCGINNLAYGGHFSTDYGGIVHIEDCDFDNFINIKLYNELSICGLDARIINSRFYANCTGSSGDRGSYGKFNIGLFNTNKSVINNTFLSCVSFEYSAARDYVISQNSTIRLDNFSGTIRDNKINTNSSYEPTRDGIDITDNFYTTWSNHQPNTRLIIKNNIITKCKNPLNIFQSGVHLIGNSISYGNYSFGAVEVKLAYDESCSYIGNSHAADVSPLLTNYNTSSALGFPFYSNIFEQGGIIARGNFKSTVNGIKLGQQFKCNTFNNNSSVYDIDIDGGTGIAEEQRFRINNTTYSNENKFSPSALKNLRNNVGTNTLNYYYYNSQNCSNPDYPCNNINVNTMNLGSASINYTNCPGVTNWNTPTGNLSSTLLSLAPPLDNSLSSTAKGQLMTSLTEFNDRVVSIRSANLNPCSQTIGKLQYEPILLTSSDFNNIAILRNYVKGNLTTFQNLTSSSDLYQHRDILLSTYTEMNREINNVLEDDMNVRAMIDSTITNDSIEHVFREIPHPSSEYKIASIYIKKNQYDDAIAIFNNIHNLYTIDSIDSLNAAKMVEMAVLKKTLYLSNREYRDMTFAEILTLRDIASYDNTKAGKYACQILGKTFGECTPEYANNMYPEQNSSDISISPNPSNGLVHIQISNTANINNIYVLKIYTNTGVLVSSQPLMGIELENVDIDISSWQNGYYYVNLYSNGSMIKSKMMQKN